MILDLALFCGQPIDALQNQSYSSLNDFVQSKSFKSWKESNTAKAKTIVEVIKHIDGAASAIVKSMPH